MSASYNWYEGVMIDLDADTYAFNISSDIPMRHQLASPEKTAMEAVKLPDDESDVSSMTWSEGLREIDEGFPEPKWNDIQQGDQIVKRYGGQDEMEDVVGKLPNIIERSSTLEDSLGSGNHTLESVNREAPGTNEQSSHEKPTLSPDWNLARKTPEKIAEHMVPAQTRLGPDELFKVAGPTVLDVEPALASTTHGFGPGVNNLEALTTDIAKGDVIENRKVRILTEEPPIALAPPLKEQQDPCNNPDAKAKEALSNGENANDSLFTKPLVNLPPRAESTDTKESVRARNEIKAVLLSPKSAPVMTSEDIDMAEENDNMEESSDLSEPPSSPINVDLGPPTLPSMSIEEKAVDVENEEESTEDVNKDGEVKAKISMPNETAHSPAPGILSIIATQSSPRNSPIEPSSPPSSTNTAIVLTVPASPVTTTKAKPKSRSKTHIKRRRYSNRSKNPSSNKKNDKDFLPDGSSEDEKPTAKKRKTTKKAGDTSKGGSVKNTKRTAAVSKARASGNTKGDAAN